MVLARAHSSRTREIRTDLPRRRHPRNGHHTPNACEIRRHDLDNERSYWVTRAAGRHVLGVNRAMLAQLADKGALPFEVHADGTRLFRRKQLATVANARDARKGVLYLTGRTASPLTHVRCCSPTPREYGRRPATSRPLAATPLGAPSATGHRRVPRQVGEGKP